MPGLARRTLPATRSMLMRCEFDQGCAVPTHQHPQEQFTLILEGRLRFRWASPAPTSSRRRGRRGHGPGGRPAHRGGARADDPGLRLHPIRDERCPSRPDHGCLHYPAAREQVGSPRDRDLLVPARSRQLKARPRAPTGVAVEIRGAGRRRARAPLPQQLRVVLRPAGRGDDDHRGRGARRCPGLAHLHRAQPGAHPPAARRRSDPPLLLRAQPQQDGSRYHEPDTTAGASAA